MTSPATTADPARDEEFDDLEQPRASRVPWAFGIWLIVAGVIGEIAAFTLTLEKFEKLVNPGHAAGCDISVLVQCTANLESWQGSAFGFPNPLIGLVGWMAPIVVGFALLAGARFARWFRILFLLGMTFAVSFVVWLINQSIFELGTLCPWCLVTWSVTIPTFFAVLFRSMADGVLGDGERIRTIGRTLGSWIVPLTIVCFGVILLLAQIELDAFNRL